MTNLSTLRWLAVAVFTSTVANYPHLACQNAPDANARTERMSVVKWSAELSGKREIPTIVSDATGKADFGFDFAKRKATVHLVTHNLKDVSRIELRVRRSAHDASGPTLITIYDASHGPFSGSISKTFPTSRFEELANAITNGLGVVTVCTKSHPNGEITGRVRMFKSYQ